MKRGNGEPNTLLFVDHSQALGGAEHSLLLLMQHLDPANWQPHLACPAGDLADAAQRLGIPWHEAALPRLRRSWRVGLDWRQQAGLLSEIAGWIGAGALVANTVRAAFYVLLAASLSKRPFLWYMRDFWLSETRPRHPRFDALFKKILCHRADQVIANSAATAQHLPCPNVVVVHNGIDLSQFSAHSDGTAFRQRFGIPPNAPLVGTVGRLRRWKGQHRFIEMAAKVALAQPDAHFVIAGGTPFGTPDNYPDQLHQLAIEKNVANRLHFTGHLPDAAPIMAALDIFVHSGDPEPFGLVNIEAMAAGKPVIAFAHGALPEIVVPGKTGLLVPPYDQTSMAEAVLSLLRSPQQRGAMGEAGRQRVEQLFDIRQTAVRLSGILQKTGAGGQ